MTNQVEDAAIAAARIVLGWVRGSVGIDPIVDFIAAILPQEDAHAALDRAYAAVRKSSDDELRAELELQEERKP